MENNYFVKRAGVISIDHVEPAYDKSKCKNPHLCAKCHNAEPNMCSKIADEHKKDLIDYDFITEGYQTFDESGESDVLVVEKCKNFVPMKNYGKPKKQLAAYKKLKGQLACGYFDVATPDEAYLLQVELFERGHLNINKDYLPSEKTLNAIRQRIRK